jgi:hypothetical protein
VKIDDGKSTEDTAGRSLGEITEGDDWEGENGLGVGVDTVEADGVGVSPEGHTIAQSF